MDLPCPTEISLDNPSLALIRDVEETARRVNEHRPLPPDVVRRIEDELLGSRVFSSNAIEGSSLDLRETIMILKSGVVGARKKRDAVEARNLGDAARKILEWKDVGQECYTSERLREVHGIIVRQIDDEWAGRYRDFGVMIRAAKYQPPDESLVPSLIDQAMEMLRESTDANAVLAAVWAHWAIARIHPFRDGNGRVARLWQDLVLYQNGLTCAVIRPEDRREYFDALGQADEGDFDPLVQLVAQRISFTFDKYLTAIRDREQEDEFVKQLAAEADSRAADTRKLAYVRWSRRMEQLRWEFEIYASKISDASKDIKIQVRPYDLIDQSRWENIRSRHGAERTWYFIVDCFAGQRRIRYFFFFGFHYWRDLLDDEHDRSEQRVCLLVSEGEGSGEARRLEDVQGCPVTLREIFIVDGGYVRRRFDPGSGNEVYDRNIAPLEIAKDFFREVVLGRLT
ncbi:MAG: Fic family protein [Phycisphaerae bacterium]